MSAQIYKLADRRPANCPSHNEYGLRNMAHTIALENAAYRLEQADTAITEALHGHRPPEKVQEALQAIKAAAFSLISATGTHMDRDRALYAALSADLNGRA